MASQLASHWTRLGGRLGGAPGDALAGGASAARELLRELAARTAAHGLHGFPAAQGVGGRLAGARNVAGDLLLERNQALRAAVLDVAHVDDAARLPRRRSPTAAATRCSPPGTAAGRSACARPRSA